MLVKVQPAGTEVPPLKPSETVAEVVDVPVDETKPAVVPPELTAL